MRRTKVVTRGFWSNRWAATLRDLRKRPLQEWSAEFLDQGLRIQLDSWLNYRNGYRETIEFEWAEICQVTAYKTDEFSLDTIWLEFQARNGDAAALPENAPQWKQVASVLPAHFAGCPEFRAWYPGVVQPPFASNLTVLYGGPDRGGGG